MRHKRLPWVWAMIAVLAFPAMTIESASAHDQGCDGNALPVRIKLDCCGKADEHQLKSEQIRRGANGEYIVSFEDYTFVIPADRRCPATITAAISFSRTCGRSPAAIRFAFQGHRTCAVSSRRWTSDRAPEPLRLGEAEMASEWSVRLIAGICWRSAATREQGLALGLASSLNSR